MAADYICEMREYLKTAYLGKFDPLCGHPSMNIGTITGGSFANVVPPSAEITLDRRTIPGESIKDFWIDIEIVLARCLAKDPTFNADYETILDLIPVCFPVETPLFTLLRQSIDSTRETPICHGTMAGWGEAGTIQLFGIPAIYYGPGSMQDAHTPTENVPIKEIIGTAKGIYAVIDQISRNIDSLRKD
jgi:acetylornithine deacetylase/succinyl-diaminopimelate desuccinylase-like protein